MEGIQLAYAGKKSVADIMEMADKVEPVEISDKNYYISSDNFRAMAGLLKAGCGGNIDLIYIDPPYNTQQVFSVGDERVSTISRSGDAVAYADDMTMAEYLEFMRERLLLMRELLSDAGSIYLHIDCKMGHYLKMLMDEVFGMDNFLNDIARIKSNPKNFNRPAYGNQRDMVLFYAKNKGKNIYNNVTASFTEAELADKFKKVDPDGRRYNTVPVHAPGETQSGDTGGYWRDMLPPKGRHWRTNPAELDKLDAAGRIEWSKNGVPRIKKYADEHKGKKIQDVWNYIDPAYPLYPTEKNLDMLKMIVQQSSHENSLVMDCFAGSGSTLLAAQLTGRRWLGIDQSEYSAKVVRERFADSNYEFITLPEGIEERVATQSGDLMRTIEREDTEDKFVSPVIQAELAI